MAQTLILHMDKCQPNALINHGVHLMTRIAAAPAMVAHLVTHNHLLATMVAVIQMLQHMKLIHTEEGRMENKITEQVQEAIPRIVTMIWIADTKQNYIIHAYKMF